MISAGVNFQLFDHFSTEAAFRKHAAYCGFDNYFRLLLKHNLKGSFLETTGVVSVLVVGFLVQLVAGNSDLVSIQNTTKSPVSM